jgi:glycosyltransferase involved in cell wall biosynthesis
MRFLFDAHHLGLRQTGNETWTRNVVAAMGQVAEPGEVVYAVSAAGRAELQRLTGASGHVVSGRSAQRLLVDLPRVARRARTDAVFTTYTVPPMVRPSVVIVHDVASWDPRGPEWMPLRTRLRTRLTVGASARLASQVLVLTEVARNEVIQRLGRAPIDVIVASAAVDAELAALLATTGRRPAPDQFTVLVVGAVLPRKNLLVLAHAVRALRATGVAAQLRVVGPVPEAGRDIAARLRLLLGPGVALVGYVTIGELAAEYRSADAFCFPSLLEGFGMPILEAMAAGTPVVISDASSLPEVAGGAALVCAADDPRAWREALLRLSADPVLRERLRAIGHQRVPAFSWQRTAGVVISSLRRAGAGSDNVPASGT